MASVAVPDAPVLLLVDDDSDILEALSEVLSSHGYTTRCAGNGAEALVQLTRRPPPALVLLDLMMPVMNGWELLAQMAERPDLAHIPVVVLSASQDRVEGGAVVRQLSKPFAVTDLLSQVRSTLGA